MDFWKGKHVFITGGNGFLGAQLTKELLKYGAHPVVLVYEENPGGIFEQDNLAEQVTVIRGDIRDYALLDTILRDHIIDTIFHLAAQAIVDQAIDVPLATFEANIQGTWNVLEAARKNPQVERVIIASSDKAYGAHENLPYQEDTHALNPGYPYEVSKTCADLISQSYFKTFGVPVTITRCANLYGPGDLKENRLIPRTIRNLHHGEAPIIRDTGESLRDYLFVEDAAEAYRLLAEKMDSSIYGEVFNFATATPISVKDAIAQIADEIGIFVEPIVVKTHGKEIRHQYASFDKAKSLLGWVPRHSFKEGLKKTIPWYVRYFQRGSAEKSVVTTQ